jgi:hypothetical protein
MLASRSKRIMPITTKEKNLTINRLLLGLKMEGTLPGFCNVHGKAPSATNRE